MSQPFEPFDRRRSLWTTAASWPKSLPETGCRAVSIRTPVVWLLTSPKQKMFFAMQNLLSCTAGVFNTKKKFWIFSIVAQVDYETWWCYWNFRELQGVFHQKKHWQKGAAFRILTNAQIHKRFWCLFIFVYSILINDMFQKASQWLVQIDARMGIDMYHDKPIFFFIRLTIPGILCQKSGCTLPAHRPISPQSVEELREKYPEVEVQFSTECSLLGMAMVFGRANSLSIGGFTLW